MAHLKTLIMFLIHKKQNSFIKWKQNINLFSKGPITQNIYTVYKKWRSLTSKTIICSFTYFYKVLSKQTAESHNLKQKESHEGLIKFT